MERYLDKGKLNNGLKKKWKTKGKKRKGKPETHALNVIAL